MLLWLVKWRPGYQDAVELSSDVAFQTAGDFGLGLALFGASLDVGAGRPVPGHPPDRDQVQRPVRLPVAAPVQPVPGDLARGGRARRDPAQVRERGLAAQPFGMSPAATSSTAAVSVPTPLTATSAGAAMATS